MKFKYTYSIEIETEIELPVLGYDLHKASQNLTKDQINYILERCIKDDKDIQTFEFDDRVYVVNKKHELRGDKNK